jgi:ATP-dependent Clp protease ATP-binding subunit ClpA
MKRKMVRLSYGEKSETASKLFELLKQRVKGQDPVISNFVKHLEGLTSGLRRGNTPVYKGLFLGLPNVGKRLFIESLAEILFGNRKYYSEISCGAFNPETVSIVPALLSRAEIDLPLLLRDKDYRRMSAGQNNLQEKLGKKQAELFKLCQDADNEALAPEELKRKIAETTKHCVNLIKAINTLGKKMDDQKPKNAISIVVFSDFERSCPAMISIIQRVLRDGYVHFETGEEVDLTNSIVIVTSTVISDVILDEMKELRKGKLGFEPSNKEHVEKMDKAIYDRFANDTKKIYKSSMAFATENISLDFLSSFDRISIFRPLFEDSLNEIFDLEFTKFVNELQEASFPISFEISDKVKSFIVGESIDHPEFGASTLLAKFDKYISREVARLKNRKEIKEEDTVFVDVENGKVVFSKKVAEKENSDEQ